MKWLWLILLGEAASAADVGLRWNPVAEAVGYRVHVGGRSRAYVRVMITTTTTARLKLGPGRHFLAVTAFDANGLESEFSEELTYRVDRSYVVREITAGSITVVP